MWMCFRWVEVKGVVLSGFDLEGDTRIHNGAARFIVFLSVGLLKTVNRRWGGRIGIESKKILAITVQWNDDVFGRGNRTRD